MNGQIFWFSGLSTQREEKVQMILRHQLNLCD